ncbi:MAG: cell division protein FtsA [Candidatus Pacebacteria bacterium]|nr:cell division protein FtsA [Candidatus Paceibacterota bacterium]
MSKGHIITGIDIGSSEIKVLVASKKPDKEEIDVLSLVQEPSFGVRKGVVIDPNGVAEILQLALNKAKEESRQRIESAYVNIGGSHIFSAASHGLISVSRADRKISQEDIDRVLHEAQTISLPSNKEILEVFPREFFVDGEGGLKEVLSMEGVRLEADVLAIGVFSPYLKNLTQTILNSEIQINDLTPSPLASARAVLKKREKELGTVLLDIGAGTTGMSVFEEGELIQAIVLPIGSNHITNDIAVGLKIDVDLAEKIKLEFGNCLFRGNDKKEKIEVGEEDMLTFSHKQVAEIISVRVSEIFDEVNKELKKISKQGKLPGGVVLTGGGAKLPKISELAKKELKLTSRIGKPLGFSTVQDDISLATVCGLVLGGYDIEEAEGGANNLSIGKGLGSKIKKLFKIFIP